jgi:Domain of unknown function (DUF4404)
VEDELRRDLAELRAGIERFEDGEEERDQLAALIDRVEAHLAEPEDEGLVDHARASATRFENDHPDLSRLLERIVDTLSASGL